MLQRLPVYGYHGTSIKNARTILQDGFELSRNHYDWLGTGAYFFQDAPNRAWEWAEQHHSEPAVVSALISSENFIDLLDIEWFPILEESHILFVRECEKTGIPIPKQTPKSGTHQLDYAVMNYAIAKVIEVHYDTKVYGVRAAFEEGEPAFKGSHLLNQAHVQIAVRDTSAVKQIRLHKPTRVV